MLESKNSSNFNLSVLLLWLGWLIPAIIVFGYLRYSGSTHDVAVTSKEEKQSQTDHYYSPQVYHLPLEIISKNLMENTNHESTSTFDLPILLYHYIEPLKPNDHLRDNLTVIPEKFSEQLNLIKQSGWQTISINQVADQLKGPLTKHKQIALTFDDGYRDFYKYAFPLLKQNKIKATLYIIYDTINDPAYLTEEMIKEMLASGLVEIGSHALDHKKLTLLGAAEAKRQIFLSKKMLEERFRIPIVSFAYPYGSFNQELADLVQKAGYKAAVTVVAGEKQSEANRFFLSRLRSTNKDVGQFIKHLWF